MTKGIDIEVGYVSFNSEVYALQIWDFGGQKQFRFFLQLLLKGAKGVIYVYDMTDYETLVELREFVASVRSLATGRPPVEILVGTKADEPPEVTPSDIQLFLRDTNIPLHYEVSGLRGINVHVSFEALAKLVHARETARVATVLR